MDLKKNSGYSRMASPEMVKRFIMFSGIYKLLPAIYFSVLDNYWPYIFISPEKYSVDLVKRLPISF